MVILCLDIFYRVRDMIQTFGNTLYKDSVVAPFQLLKRHINQKSINELLKT